MKNLGTLITCLALLLPVFAAAQSGSEGDGKIKIIPASPEGTDGPAGEAGSGATVISAETPAGTAAADGGTQPADTATAPPAAGKTERTEDAAQQCSCAAELRKFCRNVQGGRAAQLKCLKRHETALSAACRNTAGRAGARPPDDQPCTTDIQKFCRDVQGGQAARMTCITQHSGVLSRACAAKLAAARGRRAGKGERGQNERTAQGGQKEKRSFNKAGAGN
ncbi:MAG: hypothetical protein NTY45_03935 [Elusimicrobia bacterium]|nr:hypothetical protein [Elusimicrobiota bacterium]